VLMAGYPGTRASFWQQAGRAGRAGQDSLAVLVCRDDPLDTYLAHHPEALLGRPVEASVLDPDNPYVLGPHLAAAAAELPVTEADVELFGPRTPEVLAGLVADGLLRRRATGWYWVRPERASDLTDIRGSGERPVRVVEAATGRLLGTVEQGAHATAHAGAVYLHQGATWLVRSLDLVERVALAEPVEVDYSTFAREVSDIRVVDQTQGLEWGDTRLALGTVDVTSQVVSFLRKRVVTGEVLGEEALDLPRRTLRTRAVWWTVTPQQLDRAGLEWSEVPGAAHAAEHAAIGLLPLFATCDRWDIGGVSTALHPDTGLTTVFVHDGHPGGAGFAERGFAAAEPWLRATLEAVSSCECEQGCPSCVQSPKCGNGNDPLSKAGAVALLRTVLRDAPR
jgi:DEAD/DEAH box helicase domain-containing protein